MSSGATFFKYWNRMIKKFDIDPYNTANVIELGLLSKRYYESHRHYHTLEHIVECFDTLDNMGELEDRTYEFWMSLFYHDAVYDPMRLDNEAHSAALASQASLNMLTDVSKIVFHSEIARDLIYNIMMTKTHNAIPCEEAAILVDVDLAILGSSPERFQKYEDQIRAEYSFVPEEIYNVKRAEIMKGFAQRSPLFLRQSFRDKFEEQAKHNLSRYLK